MEFNFKYNFTIFNLKKKWKQNCLSFDAVNYFRMCELN